jgi:hypothetical protein
MGFLLAVHGSKRLCVLVLATFVGDYPSMSCASGMRRARDLSELNYVSHTYSNVRLDIYILYCTYYYIDMEWPSRCLFH